MSSSTDWPLWEVFVRSRRGLSHTHAGSLHAPDAEMALRNARDLYTRRERTKTSHRGQSVWVMRVLLPSRCSCAWRRGPPRPL